MEQNYCAHCFKRRESCDLKIRTHKGHEKPFCKDTDCYLKYARARQPLSQIKRMQSNIRNYSTHKRY